MTTVSFRDGQMTVPVASIYCLGRNYPDHAREMRAEIPAEPVVFLKPASALLHSGGTVIIPPFSREMHHEVELVVLIGTGGRDIPRHNALDHVAGYAVGLDMTLRDVQTDAKKHGLPWTVAKGFVTSAPISAFVPRETIPDPHQLKMTLRVNGGLRQETHTGKMVFRIDRIIEYLSTVFSLQRGDVIFTGTPEGVGRVLPGDLLEAHLESVGSLTVHIS